MPVPITKPTQLRVRIADEDMPLIESLAGRILTPPAVAAMLLAAAIEAVREARANIPFPPRFIVNTAPRPELALNEKPTNPRK